MAAAEQQTTKPQAPAPAAASKGDVAIIGQPRLPYHPAIGWRFGVDRASWRALTDAVFPAAKTTDAVILALSYCKARKLDPFKRVVHIVPVWDKEKREYVETVWPGIAEHRTTAFRTKLYAGADAATFGPTITKTFRGTSGRNDAPIEATVTFPEWAQLTVYRLIAEQRVPVPGPRVYWTETFSARGRSEVPNERWCRAPFQMIEKCAEAAALRRAFPEELGDEGTIEEIGVHERNAAGEAAKDVTPPRPTRADFQPQPAAAGQAAADPEPEPEPWEFIDAEGEVAHLPVGPAWAAAFLAALRDPAIDFGRKQGVWETNSPALSRLRELEGGDAAADEIHRAMEAAMAAEDERAAKERAAAQAPASESAAGESGAAAPPPDDSATVAQEILTEARQMKKAADIDALHEREAKTIAGLPQHLRDKVREELEKMRRLLIAADQPAQVKGPRR